jgi:hypothetical protein
MIASSIIMAIVTLAIVFSPLGLFLELVQPPLWFLGLIFGILGCYFLLVEGLKHLFFSRYEV